jgi:DNA-binding XRE family transcriptional regulator
LARSTVQLLERGQGRLSSFAQALSALRLELTGRNLPAGAHLGSQLAALRKRRGLSQRELAAELSVATNTVNALERRVRGRVETLDLVLAYLGAGAYLASMLFT